MSQPEPAENHSASTERPIVELFSVYPQAPPPQPASANLRGSMPVRAVQHCAPITAASGFGFYLYPSFDFALRWDGELCELSLLEDNEPVAWKSMSGNAAPQIPDHEQVWGGMAPERRQQMLAAGEDELSSINFDPRDPNTFELHTGVIARTRPGWSLLVRAVPNLPPIPGLRVLDGILETSWFRGMVPVTGRVTDVGRVVRVHRNYPLACVQPVPDVAYDPRTMSEARIGDGGFNELPDDVWDEMIENFARRNHERVLGSYKSESRKRSEARRSSAHQSPPEEIEEA
jgi:hypothetical protein